MSDDWEQVIKRFEHLKEWSQRSLEARDDWKDNPEKTPFFVAHAEFLYHNAAGMLELLPHLREDDQFYDLTIGIENFIFFIGLPETHEHIVQIWSEEVDTYTLCLLDVDGLAPQQIKTVTRAEVPDLLIDYLMQIEALIKDE